jgi:hypothetical protein
MILGPAAEMVGDVASLVDAELGPRSAHDLGRGTPPGMPDRVIRTELRAVATVNRPAGIVPAAARALRVRAMSRREHAHLVEGPGVRLLRLRIGSFPA